jgi:hypothetical protein
LILRSIDQARLVQGHQAHGAVLAVVAAEFDERDWSGDRIYRRDGIGAKLLDGKPGG